MESRGQGKKKIRESIGQGQKRSQRVKVKERKVVESRGQGKKW